MSSSNNNVSSGPTVAQQPLDQSTSNFVFVLPPPPTVWIQFNDGMRMAFTPSPAQYLQSVLSGTPLFGSRPGSDDTNGNGFASALNELFQRAQAQQHGPPPTSKLFLEKLPVKTWTESMQKTDLHNECVICLSDYKENEMVISLPCGHTFHKDCGMTWLVEHNVCPTCRYELPTQSNKPLNQPTESSSTLTTIEPTSTPATAEPEQEPTLHENASLTGVRRSRPIESFRPRDVRQRFDEPALSLNETVLDDMLEEEAERLVKEEMEKRQIAVDDQDAEIDRDVEEFLNESSS
ncbi:zinc finger protein [Plasmopara halstedii]|uniref:Zinc finger protein n=1 Tax=Plasmopara halstedii TaxID=4781 RepID=A0A0P1AUF5_PLAHL|nr:zinc finger protein [Plasmopara halstedii]CEG46000.1 zinc finger protein [Plasmopara halstedii]|eukprot:XP_024582369.1 zinc finger protein [Plasmopara halstedii]